MTKYHCYLKVGKRVRGPWPSASDEQLATESWLGCSGLHVTLCPDKMLGQIVSYGQTLKGERVQISSKVKQSFNDVTKDPSSFCFSALQQLLFKTNSPNSHRFTDAIYRCHQGPGAAEGDFFFLCTFSKGDISQGSLQPQAELPPHLTDKD